MNRRGGIVVEVNAHRLSAIFLAIALAVTTFAQTSTPAPANKQDANKQEDGPLRKLSKRERKEKLAKLDERLRDFVSDVEPIMMQPELDSFLLMENDAQREAFMVDFWRRRDEVHGTSSFRDAYYARLEIAKERFRKVSSDRSKIFLLQGPPAEVTRVNCDRLLQPIEVWRYEAIKGLGQDVRMLFYQPRNHNDYKIWNPIGGSMALAELSSGGSVAMTPTDEQAARRAFESNSPYSYVSQIQLGCKDGDAVVKAITQMIQYRVDLLRVFEPPPVNTEDMNKVLRTMVISNPQAKKLSAEFSVRYPEKRGSRTDAQMTLLIPRDELVASVVGEGEVYTVDVVGEVLRDDRLWERYRYRFDFPGDTKGEKLPIVIDRLLRPNEYVSRIKIVDANTGAEALVENELIVPEIYEPEKVQLAAATTVPEAKAEAGTTVAQLKNEAIVVEPKLRIVPPTDEVVNGMQTVQTLISGDAIKAVEFWLDGKKIAVRRSPPFSLDLDFGNVPQMRRIRAIGLGAKDELLTGDDIVVNAGTDPFRVRITSPRIAPKLVGPAKVEIDLSVPDGRELESLELYWNERRVATMHDAPFVHTVDIPASEGVGYLRAVARLKDDDQAQVEDVVLINTPAYMEELNVHLVELPTTVLIGGKPSDKLTEKSFKVLDDGKPVAISKFEHVKNLPLNIGMAMDSSGSMHRRMDEAQKAGAQFFQNVMKKGDRAFLVAFDSQPQVVQRWSTKIGDIHAGLAKLRAEESTALYDAVVYSLYNFLGVKGQKALILISDGKDTASNFTFDQALEYARRAAVPIYAIGIGIKGNEMDVRFKLSKLASETGGSTYYIEQAKDLEKIYGDIQAELRSQYVIGFYPPADVKSGKWREVTVQSTEGKVKTIRGYFP
ncbi:MAG TPA: VWA domain-containing protein [Thermoanaerobaculia bacterium]|jgi:Ca-activated chloride channel family protein